jgi:RnfABCDGE-type electron transport complex B subunit
MKPNEVKELADRLEDLLPQTQCTKCGYPDCRGYAQALAKGEAAPNQCPPGGVEGIKRLSQVLTPMAALFVFRHVLSMRSLALLNKCMSYYQSGVLAAIFVFRRARLTASR